MKTVKIIYKKPNEFPAVMEIEDTIENYQDLVGGYIETVSFNDKTLIVCNEEGKLLGLEPNIIYNGDCIVGPVIFVDYNDDGDFVDCSITLDDFIRCLI